MQINRRDFLRSTVLTGTALAAAPRRWGWGRREPRPDALKIACIGVGGMGARDLDSLRWQNIVALCDVDEKALAEQALRHPTAQKFTDFRKMLETVGRTIDAVTVSTPDHTHFVAAMTAMKMGKHVFVQKPLTHDLYEARTLTEAAARYKVATQMGNQGTSSRGLREAVEVVQSGAIGPVREVHVWTDRPTWPHGCEALLGVPGVQAALHGSSDGGGDPPVPEGLNWDLWLGPAPARRFYPEIYHPRIWRGWWDFGTGAIGDMGCHTANLAFMACKLRYPSSVEAEVSDYNAETYPTWSVIRYEFPARGELPPLKLTWYDGGINEPPWVKARLRELAGKQHVPISGSLLLGDKGILFSPGDYGEDYDLLPDRDFRDYEPPAPSLPRSPGHKEEWFAAIREKKPALAMSNFSYAGPLTETILLGCIAMRVRKKLLWDGPNMKITNDAAANQYLKREPRPGWTV